jgi:uncharacterized protein YbcI
MADFPQVEDEQPPEPRNAPLLQISNGVVALHKRFYGKGPGSCRVMYHGDVVVVVLRGNFTHLEAMLVASGRVDPVLQQRRALQLVTEEAMKALVTDATGREVEAFMSANHAAPDAQVEVFLLRPEG